MALQHDARGDTRRHAHRTAPELLVVVVVVGAGGGGARVPALAKRLERGGGREGDAFEREGARGAGAARREGDVGDVDEHEGFGVRRHGGGGGRRRELRVVGAGWPEPICVCVENQPSISRQYL